MRYAIVDNSTLSAAQRVLGEVEIYNSIGFDGDLVAFENLVQAILFYDKIFYINDYKEEYKAARGKYFKMFTPIETNEIPYQDLLNQANASVSSIFLEVKAGKITPNEIGKFLESLKLHTTYTWDMQSSNFFLTMKMLKGPDSLDIEKYSKLNQMIFSELSANRSTSIQLDEDRRPLLIDSSGRLIERVSVKNTTTYEVAEQVYGFSSSLNWLSLRTAFYTLLSSQLQADSILHPIRSAFQLSFAGAAGFGSSTLRQIIIQLVNQISDSVGEIRQNTDPVLAKMTLPIFSAWIVSKTKDPREIIDFAYKLRSDDLFVGVRSQLIELEDLIENKKVADYVTKVNNIVKSLEKTAAKMREEFGLSLPSGFSITPIIFAANVALSMKGLPTIPEINMKIKIPELLKRNGNRNNFQGVLRSVTHDLSAIERLGEVYDKLKGAAKFRKNEHSGKPLEIIAKTEDVRYFGKASHWKRPM